MRVKNGLVLFWDGPFSNFDYSPFKYKDKEFFCSEQAFMFMKAITFGDSATANKILECANPADAKALGRKVVGYDDAIWEEVRYQIMLDVCIAKFQQSVPHKEALLQYGAHGKFVEASPYDKIWGIGLGEDHVDAADPTKWRGRNLLGLVLDNVYALVTK